MRKKPLATITPGPSATLSSDADRRAIGAAGRERLIIFRDGLLGTGLLSRTRHLDERCALEIAEPPLWRIIESSDSWLFRDYSIAYSVREGDGQNEGCDAQKRFKTTQGKRQGQAQVGSKTSHGEKSKVEGSARRRSCSQIQDKKTAATKSCGNQGFKENTEPSSRGAGRRHDHRRDR